MPDTIRTLRRRHWVIALLVILGVGVLVFLIRAPQQPGLPLFDDVPVVVTAHRGASGYAPENTLPAFELALEMGAHVLEMDLHLSADGHVMVIHDPTVDRTTGTTGRVADLTLEALQELDAGYYFEGPEGGHPHRGRGIGIPTLTEVLEAFPYTPLILELKPDAGEALAEAAAELIERYAAQDRVIVASFSARTLRRFRRFLPEVPTHLTQGEALTFLILGRLRLHPWYRPPAELLMAPEQLGDIRVVTPASVGAADRLGIGMHVWTVNEPQDMRRLVDMGVHGIMTDYPDRLLRVLAERNPLPEE